MCNEWICHMITYDYFKYALVKIGILTINELGEKYICPIDTKSEEWKEFLILNKDFIIKIDDNEALKSDNKLILGDDIYFGQEVRGGSYNVKPSIGYPVALRSKISNGIRTSNVTEILSDNIFVTNNSVYFLIDDSWRKKINRDKKINEIINGEI